MTEDDPFFQYHFVGIDPKHVRPLHELVVQYRDELLANEILQNLLIYPGRDPLPQRPTSYYDLADSVWKRSEVALHLQYLDHVMGIATQPALITFEREPIHAPGIDLVDPRQSSSMEIVAGRTSRGHDPARVEEIQRHWLTSPETEIVRSYKTTLERSFAQFNLQFILGRIDRCKETPLFESWPEIAYQIKIQQVFTPKAHYHLDNAYYNQAGHLLRLAEPLWRRLSESEYGQFFILTAKEVRAGASTLYEKRLV